MVVLGVVVFAAASAMCGLTPRAALAEAWIVTFRVVQGAGGAIMFPAALAIVVQTFPLRERGKALATFFGIAGGLTAIGPILGGYLTQWTWRAIFWVNIPVALIALVLIVLSKPVTVHRPARMDYRGLVLIASGVALSVFGFQQSTIWGWSNPGHRAVHRRRPGPPGGLRLRRAAHRLAADQVRIFRIRAFLVENLVLGIAMLVFIPVFFFASEYAQISLGKSASEAGLFLLYFFIGFVWPPRSAAGCSTGAGPSAPVVLGLRPRRGGLLPVGRQGHPAQLPLPEVVHRPGRGGHGPHARAGQHRRRQPGLAPLLRRGHRHHPDGAELRRQPGPGHPRHGPGLPDALPRDHLAGGPGPVPATAARATAAQSQEGQRTTTGSMQIPHVIRLDFAYATRADHVVPPAGDPDDGSSVGPGPVDEEVGAGGDGRAGGDGGGEGGGPGGPGGAAPGTAPA
jgi:MFS family permease